MSQFKVVQSGYQIESQTETTAAFAISLRHYPKDFDVPNHVFNYHHFGRQFFVCYFLLSGQLPAFRLFQKYLENKAQFPPDEEFPEFPVLQSD